jgi:hypothetical protein
MKNDEWIESNSNVFCLKIKIFNDSYHYSFVIKINNVICLSHIHSRIIDLRYALDVKFVGIM